MSCIKMVFEENKNYNMWVVLYESHPHKGHRMVKCKCECGTIRDVDLYTLINNKTQSCGCIIKTKGTNKTHDKSFTKTYKSWGCMIQRCTNPNNDAYKNYGGRGITVCERWLNSFEDFLEDMGERPIGTTLDRIKNDGNYELSNCKWSTSKEQNNNKRNNIKQYE